MSAIFIYGRPGSGKSTFAASFTKLGYRVHFIDVDNKIKTMRNLKPLIQAQSVTTVPIESPVEESTLLQRAKGGIGYKPTRLPQGYFEICEVIENAATNPPEDAAHTVLVLDSLSRVNEHMARLLQHHSKDGKLGYDGWAAVLQNYESLFDTFYKLQPEPYAHCIICAHAKEDDNQILKVVESRPMIDGQFREKAGSYVDEMFYTFVDVKNKNAPAEFLAYTKPVGPVLQARTSIESLDVIVEQDFSEIFKGESVKRLPVKTGKKK